MNRTYISDALKAIDSTVKVQGFIENLRNSKAMAFIVLKDITGKLQITVEKADHPELVDTIDQLTPDSVITVVGKVMANDYVKMGGVEMVPSEIKIESVAAPLPIVRKAIAATKKKKAVERSSIDQRIDYRWVDLRTDENQLMFKAQSVMVNAMRQFLLNKNFIEIHTPKLIATASESGADVFKVDYFDRDAYLAQSPQFYKQMAMASGFERIFEVGPVFRAEKSFTSKHTTEFSGFDLEFSYIESYRDVMHMEEELLKAALQAVKDAYGDQIKETFGLEVVVPETPFPVVTLAELYKGLEEDFGYTVDESEKGDLTTDAERLSYEWVKKHYNHEFLCDRLRRRQARVLPYAGRERRAPGLRPDLARGRDHHRRPARAPLRGAEKAGRGEGPGRGRQVLPGVLPVRLPAPRRLWPGHRPADHAAGGPEHQGVHVPVPRAQPPHPVRGLAKAGKVCYYKQSETSKTR